MKNKLTAIGWAFMCTLVMGCSQEVTLDLPVYTPKLVMEFYLENGKTLNCLLQESINYTDTTLTKLVDNALIVLRYRGVSDTLKNQFYFDQKFEKIYNYHNNKIINLETNVEYQVYVKDAAGREMMGSTRLNKLVPIDSNLYKLDANKLAAAGLVFQDDGNTQDYYRIVAYKDSSTIDIDKLWDIRFSDIFFNGRQFSFYTGNDFNIGDTVVGRLYHLTEEHNNFVESVSNAESSNGNPFGQPANIISNVTGGIGIFTILNYDEKVMVIR